MNELRTDPCKGCRAPVIWRNTPSGATMPLDPEPVEEAVGTYVIVSASHCRPSEPMFDAPDAVHYMSHWATCPVADTFKVKKS